MAGVLRKGDDQATSTLAQGSPNVSVNGQAAVRIGDVETDGHHMVTGSSTVFVNGIGVCRAGDVDDNGEAGNPGSPNVSAG